MVPSRQNVNTAFSGHSVTGRPRLRKPTVKDAE
jgi:hypothetical protein